MYKSQKGFTLIELVMIIVILGIIAAIAIPKYVDLSTQALASAKAASSASAKAGWALYLGANNGAYPTVTQTAANVDGGTAVATGVQVTINGTTYIAPTYTDTACAVATAAVGDTVKCVKSIP